MKKQNKVINNTRRFSLVYTDPPWPWNDGGSNGSSYGDASVPYETASLEELWSIDVRAVIEDDAAMFMWCLNGFLEPAILTMERWGFSLSTVAFVWVKTTREPQRLDDGLYFKGVRPRSGMGPYTLPGAELCLIGKRGRVSSVIEMHSGVKQVQYAPVTEHSRKPALFRRLIERMTPTTEQPHRLEMFARGSIDGWTTMGDQAHGGVELPSCGWEMPA